MRWKSLKSSENCSIYIVSLWICIRCERQMKESYYVCLWVFIGDSFESIVLDMQGFHPTALTFTHRIQIDRWFSLSQGVLDVNASHKVLWMKEMLELRPFCDSSHHSRGAALSFSNMSSQR